MNDILCNIINNRVVMDINDILINSDKIEAHRHIVMEVLGYPDQ
jgi:hypothetical protein